MTKWYSSSRQLQILHNLSFTGLCGRAHLPASIFNLWDETRSLANELRNFNTFTVMCYVLKFKPVFDIKYYPLASNDVRLHSP